MINPSRTAILLAD
jgi:glycogen synthase